MSLTEEHQQYCVRYEGNNSKRWVGYEIWVDAEYMEELFEPSALVPGYEVVLAWHQKDNVTNWKAALVDPSTACEYTKTL